MKNTVSEPTTGFSANEILELANKLAAGVLVCKPCADCQNNAAELLARLEASTSMTWEMLECGNIDPNFDTRTLTFRCASCQKLVLTTLNKIKQLLSFYRPHAFLKVKKQKHFKVPFLKKEFTITVWDSETPKQSPIFFR